VSKDVGGREDRAGTRALSRRAEARSRGRAASPPECQRARADAAIGFATPRRRHDAPRFRVGSRSRRLLMLSEPIAVVASIGSTFDSLSIPYVVGGSIASSVYGTP